MASQAAVDDEIAADHEGLRARRRRGAAAAAGLPAVPQQPAAPPDQGPAPRRPRGRRAVGAGVRRTATSAPLEADLTIQHGGEPIGERIGRHRPGPRRRRSTGAAPARRGLAGQRRRPLHPQARPAPGADRPELHRRRPLPDRRRRRLPVHHDQARALPVAQPPQRLAAGAHPLLAVRHRLHPAAGHPDVLPRATRCSRWTRSTSRSPTRRPASGWSRPTTTTSPSTSGCSATAGTSCSPAATAP